MLTQGKLITSDGDLNRISKRSYLADINLAAFCDSHVHDTALVSGSPVILETTTVEPTAASRKVISLFLPVYIPNPYDDLRLLSLPETIKTAHLPEQLQ